MWNVVVFFDSDFDKREAVRSAHDFGLSDTDRCPFRFCRKLRRKIIIRVTGSLKRRLKIDKGANYMRITYSGIRFVAPPTDVVRQRNSHRPQGRRRQRLGFRLE